MHAISVNLNDYTQNKLLTHKLEYTLKLVSFTITLWLCMNHSALSAQTAKGDILAGGALYFSMSNAEGISSTDTNQTASTNFSISVFGGYFIADRFVVGLGLGYSRAASTNNYAPIELTDINSTINPEILLRYYFLDGELIKLWSGLGIRMGFGTYEDHYYAYDENNNGYEDVITDKLTTLDIGIGPGASIMLTPAIALEIYYGSIGYSTVKLKREDGSYDYVGNTFGVTFANSFGFGLAYHF